MCINVDWIHSMYDTKKCQQLNLQMGFITTPTPDMIQAKDIQTKVFFFFCKIGQQVGRAKV